MHQILGSELSPEMQKQAKVMFVYRSTGEHRCATRVGGEYPIQFADDADWLAHTLFYVTKKGTLAKRVACVSSPTWPHHPHLRSTWTPLGSLFGGCSRRSWHTL